MESKYIVKTFITADWHFNHKGMCKGTSHWTRSIPPRDFNSIDDMNDAIIDGINSVVSPNDVMWNLGDVIFSDTAKLSSLIGRIKCRDIRLILGNHDKSIRTYRINDKGRRVFNGPLSSCFTDVRNKHRIKFGDYRIYLLHEPMHTWPGINLGFIQLHGHCHGNLPDRGLRQMDVGVDTNDFRPYLLDDVVSRLLQRSCDNCPDIRNS